MMKLYRDVIGAEERRSSGALMRFVVRDPQAEANAALGAMLRMLPQYWTITPYVPAGIQGDEWAWQVHALSDVSVGHGATPEEALAKALESGEEQGVER